MTRDDIERIYDLMGDVITTPGRFDGAPVWAPAFFAREPDDNDDDTMIYEVTDEDREEFPELEDAYEVQLREGEDGKILADAL